MPRHAIIAGRRQEHFDRGISHIPKMDIEKGNPIYRGSLIYPIDGYGNRTVRRAKMKFSKGSWAVRLIEASGEQNVWEKMLECAYGSQLHSITAGAHISPCINRRLTTPKQKTTTFTNDIFLHQISP